MATNEICLLRLRFRGLPGLIGLVLLTSAWLGITPYACAQSQPYSQSKAYTSMLAELARPEISPSRLSRGLISEEVPKTTPVESHETSRGLDIETSLWRLEMQTNPWSLALFNKLTGAVWQMAPGESGILWEQAGGKLQGVPPLAVESVTGLREEAHGWAMQAKVRGSNVEARLKISALSPNVIRFSVEGDALGANAKLGLGFTAAGPFFGLGERFIKTELNGLKTTLIPTDRWGAPGHNWTYIPVPYVLTPKGMGLYVDTAWISTFDFREADDHKFTISLDGPSTDCYFLVSDGPEGIIRAYTSLTGRTPPQPAWALGVWVNSLKGRDATLAVAKRLRAEGIPASALWIFDQVDADVNMGWPYWTTGYYGPPRALADDLHQMGFKVLTYLNNWVFSLLVPYTLPNPTFQEGMRQGFFALYPDGTVRKILNGIAIGDIDFTNPQAIDWWAAMLQKIVLDYGYDGWMEDFGEGGWVGDGFQFKNGMTMREMSTLYPLVYHKVAYEVTQRLRPDGVVRFARSGYAGSQGFSINWGGDQLADWTPDHGLPSVIPAGITAGLSGYAVWAPDIMSWGLSKELWMRWVEFGALTPIMRDHLEQKPKFAVDLFFDLQTLDTFRRYAKLHNSLFPYLYTYADSATKTGLPIIRHLMLEWPNDPHTYTADHEYMLGRQILVAPVVKQGARTRDLYLPEGAWVDYWTGEILHGGVQVQVPAPLERIPILVRAGSVIPFARPDIQTLAEDLAGSKRRMGDDMIWRVFPGQASTQGSFVLYDGTQATARQGPGHVEVRVEHSPIVRQYEVVLPAMRPARMVKLSGKSLEEADCSAIEKGRAGWCADSRSGILRVRFAADNFDLQVVKH